MLTLKGKLDIIKHAEDLGLKVTERSGETVITIKGREKLIIDRGNMIWHITPNVFVKNANNSVSVRTIRAAKDIISRGGTPDIKNFRI